VGRAILPAALAPRGRTEGPPLAPKASGGYLYFAYRGKIKGIHKLELEFAGPAGHALLQLQ
jgi:hypothetical protein